MISPPKSDKGTIMKYIMYCHGENADLIAQEIGRLSLKQVEKGVTYMMEGDKKITLFAKCFCFIRGMVSFGFLSLTTEFLQLLYLLRRQVMQALIQDLLNLKQNRFAGSVF